MSIDYKQLVKKCKELNIYPKGFYNPLYLPFENSAWFDLLSERALGKTTAFLLLAMVANREFGTVAEYVRLTEDMCKKKNLDALFETIRQCNYVSIITEGKWNDVFYFANYFRFVNRDDTGKIIEKSEKPFMHVYSLSTTNKLKSSYNNPNGDIIIVDEFIDNQTPYSDFFFFLCDSMSTIFRKRLGCKVFLLANTIDCRSVWFTEQGIMDKVSKCKIGERFIAERDNLTPVYFEIIANRHDKTKQKLIDTYFNFKNPKLNAITGTDTWAYSIYPIFERSFTGEDGILHKYKYDVLQTFYILHNGFYLKCDVVLHDLYRQCVMCYLWNGTPHQDDIVVVRGNPTMTNEYNLKELPMLFKSVFCDMFENHKWYFRDNSTAVTFMSFVNSK